MNKKNFKGSFLLEFYSLFRKPINETVNKFLGTKLKNVPTINFSDFSALGEQEFRTKIMEFPYMWDPLSGLLDFTFLHPKYFFWKELPYGRDCDDFAYMWYLYHILNGRNSSVYIVTPDYDITKAHAICVVDSENSFMIFDYGQKYTAATLTELMDNYFIKNYSKDNYETISYCVMKHNIPIEEAQKIVA